MNRVNGPFLILATLAFPCWGAEEIVGCIKTATGGAVVVRGSQTIPARDGMHLLVNDILHTSAMGIWARSFRTAPESALAQTPN